MDWKNTTYSYQYGQGVLGEWAVSKLSSGQGKLELSGKTGLPIPVPVGLFGSPAEARLAAACYEAFNAFDDATFKAPEGFAPRHGAVDDGWTEKPSGTGRLVLHSSPAAGGGQGVVSLGYHPKRGIRTVHVSLVHFGGEFGAAIRDALHLPVALAVAEARLQVLGNHKRPLKDGEELAATAALGELAPVPEAPRF